MEDGRDNSNIKQKQSSMKSKLSKNIKNEKHNGWNEEQNVSDTKQDRHSWWIN